MFTSNIRKERLKLTEQEHSYLKTFATSGELKARQYKRALALLLLSKGKTPADVSRSLKYFYPGVPAVRDNYLANGLQ